MSKCSIPVKSNTAAVVVLYKPDKGLYDRLKRINTQVDTLIVVSNDCTRPECINRLDKNSIIWIENENNLGSALNIGLNEALKLKYKWCFLFDQDTEVGSDILCEMSRSFSIFPEKDKVGVIVPNYSHKIGGKSAYLPDVDFQIVTTAVTSGMLIPLSTLNFVGGMREDFIIEGIDVEYCLRLCEVGLYTVATGKTLMTHSAGDAYERNIFGRSILVTNHSPWRIYMQYRNITTIILLHGWRNKLWTINAIYSMLKKILIIVLLDKNKIVKCLNAGKGIGSGVWAFIKD